MHCEIGSNWAYTGHFNMPIFYWKKTEPDKFYFMKNTNQDWETFLLAKQNYITLQNRSIVSPWQKTLLTGVTQNYSMLLRGAMAKLVEGGHKNPPVLIGLLLNFSANN